MRLSRMMFVFVLLLFAFAATTTEGAQIEKIKVGEKGKEMWVHKENGNVTKVTDEKGEEAKKGNVEMLSIMLGGKPYTVYNVSEGAEIRTTGSDCVWRFYGGGWHQVCSYP